MTNSFNVLVEEDRRLTILQLLAESPGYRANQFLLQSALETFGHSVSMDRLKVDIAWLADQGLASAESTGGVQVPVITSRGLDVAQGRASVPGVKKPRP